MRIKRLDITGFKSFMDRSVFSFGDGITGVVGPNGCGKSNVVDAIRWVMGEQSAKNLRGRGMEDVIFNGSESHAPLAMAEVTLTFKVQEGDVLPPAFAGMPEVSVTRRLFRSGESEYLINRTTVRLLDVTELFLGTGVGTRAYSIIEQGRVGLIVSSKPEDRRSIIEEAAGITKYKARRKAAERKMEYTEQNLLRVTDIVAELVKQLESLERQAKKAEKYKRLRSEMREIELHSSSHRFLDLQSQKSAIKNRLEALSGDEKELLQQVEALEEAIAARRQALDGDMATLETLGAEVHALESQVQLDEQNIQHWNSDLEATSKRLEQLAVEHAQLIAREAEVRLKWEAREHEDKALHDGGHEDDLALSQLQTKLKALSEEQADLERRLDMDRSQLVLTAGKLANQEGQLTNFSVRKSELEARLAKNRSEAEALSAQEKSLQLLRDELVQRMQLSRQAAVDLALQKGNEEATLVKAKEAFAENEMHVIALREELADRRSRLHSLMDIQRNYEGFDRGVRAVMLKAGENSRQQGVFGLVADLVSSTPRYEKAIEAALGEKLQSVVVESRDRGLEWVEYLRSLAEGRSAFLPVSNMRAVKPAALDKSHPGVLAAAVDEVKCEEAIMPLVTALLGNVLIVDSWRSALAYPQSDESPVTLVTVDGDVLRHDGTMVGGVLEGPAVGALQKKREIDELSAEVARVEERYNEILTRHYSLQKQMSQTEAVLKGLSKNQHNEELSLATQEKDLHKAGEDLARVRERLTLLEEEASQWNETFARLSVDEEAARGEVAQGQAERELIEQRMRQMSEKIDLLKGEGALLAEQLTTLKVKVVSGQEKRESARKEIEQLLAQQTEVTERLLRVDESMSEDSKRQKELVGRMEETRVACADRAQKLAVSKQGLEELRGSHNERTQELRDKEASMRDCRAQIDALNQGLSELVLKDRELALEMEHLAAQISERHQVQLVEVLHQYHLLAPLPPESEQKLKDLRQQVERMGEINLTAIEEHSELAKRHDFLSKQKTDLEESLSQLRSAIVKIDKTSRDRFKQTFDVVNEKFQAVFPRLFGGGRASLVLTEDAHGGEPGVEIVAQPPGKKLQSVNLLSGGEKALTAVSLIFAIFLIKPTPFCLLDEVDAPLDEGNVGRYNDMVREMSKQSQFILITHNKRTMEVVDSLYGVTMEEPGVSKLVSVRIQDAVAANGDQSEVA